MGKTNHNWLLRVLPSLTDVAFLMPLVFMFSRLDGVPGMLGDGDTGWHIRAGDWMLQNKAVPQQDIFSFTMPDRPWFAWEWLWDVAFAWLHQQWGMNGVVLASVVVICLTFGLLFRLAHKTSGNPLVAIGLTVLAAAASTIHWLARPHLFTMLFLVVTMMLIARARTVGLKTLLWFGPLMLLWTNLHGGFLAGILVLLAYGAGDLVSGVLEPESARRPAHWKQGGVFLATAAAALLVSLINPYGYQLHVHIWEYLRDPEMTRGIVEFQGTDFQHPTAPYFEVFLALGLGAAIWYGSQRRFAEVFVLAGWGHLALLVVRNVPLFVLIAAPLLAPAIVAWLRAVRNAPIAGWARLAGTELLEIGEEFAPMERIPRAHFISAAALVVLATQMAAPAPGRLFKAEYDVKNYPAAAFATLSPAQRIFADDEWGDYLIYRGWSQGFKVYVDGRSDFYGSKFEKEYGEVNRGRFNWEQTLTKRGVDTVLLSPRSGLATTLKESSHWRVAYDDGVAIVFRHIHSAGPVGPISAPQGGGPKDNQPADLSKQVVIGGDDSKGERPL